MTKMQAALRGGRRCSRTRFLCLAAAALAAAAFLACLTGCEASGESDGPDDPTALKPAEEAEPSAALVSSGVSACYADTSFEEFCAGSDLIVSGTYVGKSDSFMIEPVNGATPMFFTDYYFEVGEVCKGILPDSVARSSPQRITVRQRGGAGSFTETVDSNALQPTEGQEYLLFLYRIENGADYNTEGDHFYLMSGSLGAWPLNEAGCYAKDGGEERLIEKSAVMAQVSEALAASAAANGADASGEEDSHAAYLADVEERYRNGEIPEEYYNEVMQNEQKENSQYARIMTDEEVAEYERGNPYSMGIS